MTLPATSSVEAQQADASLLFAPAFRAAFPDAAMVRDAAQLLHRLPAWDGHEGPRHRISIGPGVIAVRSRDLARAERTANRDLDAHAGDQLLTNSTAFARGGYVGVAAEADGDDSVSVRRGVVSAWSRRSRSRMVERLAQLDYSPLTEAEGTPAMLTNTYPDDWRAVVPSGKVFKRHLQLYRKRFERAYGQPLVAVWKMEFQRRGAPHVHMLMVPPPTLVDGETFREWNARTWVEVVGATGEDRTKQLAVHLGPKVVDYGQGMRASDPRRLAVYFTKHGSFSAKEYQNHAPDEWLHGEDCDRPWCAGCASVGRFWGYWHLAVATAETEVGPAEAQAAVRTMRRYARANAGWKVREFVGESVDLATGELRPAAGSKRVRFRVRRLTQRGGFLVVNSGPRFASQLAGYLDQVGGRDVRSIYGRQIGAVRNMQRPATMTAAGRGLLVRADYLRAEGLRP